jgi:hypothetical protein
MGVGGLDGERGARAEPYGSLVPGFPVYGFVFPFVLQLFVFELSGADR